MKILCLTKMVPDVENFKYDYDRNVLVRENVHLVLNPEDATALAIALDIKKKVPETSIETVSMAPRGAMPHLEDLVRRGVDRATLICDPCYVGSDTYVTSRILSRYIGKREFDWIFSGTHTLDGGTAHVPPQVAEALGLPQMSNILELDRETLLTGSAMVDVDCEEAVLRFELDRPALLGFQYSTRVKLPYIKYEDISRDVADQIRIIGNDELGFDEAEVGLDGSLTKVSKVEVKKLDRKDTRIVHNDEAGIEEVFQFMKKRGFVAS